MGASFYTELANCRYPSSRFHLVALHPTDNELPDDLYRYSDRLVRYLLVLSPNF